ncbi:MAG: hypothetical protein ACK5LO_11085 [Leucobacter sp.]
MTTRRKRFAATLTASLIALVLGIVPLGGQPALAVDDGGDGARGTAPPEGVTVAVSGTLQPVIIEPHLSDTDASHDGDHDDELSVVLVTDEGRHLQLDAETLTVAAGVDPAALSPASSFEGELALTQEAAETVIDAGFEIAPGETLQADAPTGEAAVDAILEGGETAPVAAATIAAPPTAAAVPAPSTHRLYVAVISNRGAVGSSATYSAAVEKMRSFWQAQSNGRAAFVTAQTKTYSAQRAAEGNRCGLATEFGAVIDEAAALFPGVDFSTAESNAPNHLLVLAPSACTQGYTGLGYLGSSLRSGGASVNDLGPSLLSTVTHETGHNLSLHHAGADCGWCSEYGDFTNVMGYSTAYANLPVLSGLQRRHLGIDDAVETETALQKAGGASSLTLLPRSNASGVRALKLVDTGGDEYFVEYRSGTGGDAGTAYIDGNYAVPYSLGTGLTVTRPSLVSDLFLRTSASLHGDADPTLTLKNGMSYTTPGGIGIRVTGVTSTAATLSITNAVIPVKYGVTGAPRISGTAQVGKTLTASTAGVWSPQPESVQYQWLRGGSPIAGATATTYTTVLADAGKQLSVRATASGKYNLPTVAPDSAPVAVEMPRLVSTAAPKISGTARPGNTLTASTGTWTAAPGAGTITFAYQWLRNGTPVSGATRASHAVVLSDVGTEISVRVTASAAQHVSGESTATPVTVETPQLVSTTAPKITGTAKPGNTLTASTGTWTAAPGAGEITHTRQWLRDGKTLAGQTGAKYRVQPGDVGKSITARVTAKATQHADGNASAKPVKVGKGVSKATVSAKASKQTATVAVKLTLPGTAAAKTSASVKVSLGGQTKTVRLKSGKGTVKFTKLAKKTHTAKVAYAGSTQYSKASAKAKITIRG